MNPKVEKIQELHSQDGTRLRKMQNGTVFPKLEPTSLMPTLGIPTMVPRSIISSTLNIETRHWKLSERSCLRYPIPRRGRN